MTNEGYKIEDVEESPINEDNLKGIKESSEKATPELPKDRVISSFEIRDELKNIKAGFSFKSGFATLDKLLTGFEVGELVIVTGPTKMGKTSWCQSLTANFADQGIRSLWFSYELPIREFLRKIDPVPEFYVPRQLTSNTLDWLEQKMIEARNKFDIKAVFIDHLHFVFDIAIQQNSSLGIGTVVRSIKRMAMKHGLVIFLIVHVKKEAMGRMLLGEGEPNYADCRDSSFIIQESDRTLIIWRVRDRGTDKFTNKAVLKIALDRRDGVMDEKIKLIFKENRFYEVEQTSIPSSDVSERLDDSSVVESLEQD